MQHDDSNLIVLVCVVEQVRNRGIHGDRHRVFLGRAIHLYAQDAS